MSKIIVATLSFNLVSETQKACERLYAQNEINFRHLICDLGFPLLTGNDIPDDIEEAKKSNAEALKFLAARFGSEYVKFENLGCSCNWNQVVEYIQPEEEDIFISCESDEIQNEDGWVNAQADVLKGGLAYCAPRLVEHKELLENSPHAKLETIGGHEVYIMDGNLNYGNFSFITKFINKIGGIATPSTMEIYGGLEAVLRQQANNFGEKWGLLKNITTTHTDYEKGTPNTSRLLREWKNHIIFGKCGQMQFEKWLVQKREIEKIIAQ